MHIYIHTYGRPNMQITLRSFSEELRKRTTLVVQEREAHKYRPHLDTGLSVVALPPEIQTLSPTRQWILENAETDKFVMMDDDLTFSHRLEDTGVRLHKSTQQHIKRMFDRIEAQLDNYLHVGISAREGNNHVAANSKEIGRMMRILAYRKTDVIKSGARLDRILTKQDFDMTLQLLRLGHPNLVLYNFAHNQPGSNNAGGCSAYRTPDIMSKCSHELAALHPEFVKVVEKETKTSWGGGTRTDVRISWKKAYESYDH